MQISTIGAFCVLLYLWRRNSVEKERVVLISSDYDVKEVIKDEVMKLIANQSEILEPKIEIETSAESIQTNISPTKRKKKKKRNNVQQLNLPDKWDSASISSNISSVSHTNDSASTTSSDMTKKCSVTSGDSCFVSNVSGNTSPSKEKLQ